MPCRHELANKLRGSLHAKILIKLRSKLKFLWLRRLRGMTTKGATIWDAPFLNAERSVIIGTLRCILCIRCSLCVEHSNGANVTINAGDVFTHASRGWHDNAFNLSFYKR